MSFNQLLVAIDNLDRFTICDLSDRLGYLDWNQVTPSGNSALWWALSPPDNRVPDPDVVRCLLSLKRNGIPLINSKQTYMDVSPIDYMRLYTFRFARELTEREQHSIDQTIKMIQNHEYSLNNNKASSHRGSIEGKTVTPRESHVTNFRGQDVSRMNFKAANLEGGPGCPLQAPSV